MKALLLVLVLAGCGTPRRGLPIVGPLEMDATEARGERVFMRQCNGCHPHGEGGLGPSINDRPMPRWTIAAQVRVGFGAMPAFDTRDIPPDDLDALTRYLVALRRNR